MRSTWIAAALTATVLLLSGCAGLPEVPFDRPSSKVNTIGILTPSFPAGSSIVLASTVGQSFGLIGVLVDAGLQSSRESQFDALINSQNLNIPAVFVDAVTQQLRAEGYTVSIIPIERKEADFLKSPPPLADTHVDAYLDLVSRFYGYVAAGIRSDLPYRPRFVVKARLVYLRDNSVLMQDSVFYNPYGASKDVITIAPDPALQFVDFDALMADPSRALSGLRTATEQSAQVIAKLLQ